MMPAVLLRRFALWGSVLGLAVLSAGCPKHPMTNAMQPTPTLTFVNPTDGQVGLRYSEHVALTVKLARVSTTGATTPVEGAEIRFSIFGDPAGSTLSTDRGTTDGSGEVTVDLSAGSNEATFRIEASSLVAEALDFGVSVSKNELVDLDTVISLPTSAGFDPAAVSTVRGLLYMARTCKTLKPSPTADPALRQLAAAPTPAPAPGTLLEFRKLLAQSYALVGRADGKNGELLAWTCLDLPVQLVPPGAKPTLTLPLAAVHPAIGGSDKFALTTQLQPAPSELDRLSPWVDLTRCPLDPAEHLLTALVDQMAADDSTATLAATLAATRGAPNVSGCRTTANSPPDAAWATALGSGDAAEVRAIVADLVAIATASELHSELALVALSEVTLAGSHRLTTIQFTDAEAHAISLDLAVLGWASSAATITATRSGASDNTLTIAPHALVLGLPYLWGTALRGAVWQQRLPLVESPSGASLINAAIASATATGGLVGCAALAKLLCDGIAACDAPVEAACDGLGASVGARLDVALAPPVSADFVPTIAATLVDANSDLIIDAIANGSLTAPDGKMGTVLGASLP